MVANLDHGKGGKLKLFILDLKLCDYLFTAFLQFISYKVFFLI